MTLYTDDDVERGAEAGWAFVETNTMINAAPWLRQTPLRRDLYLAEVRNILDAVLPAYRTRLLAPYRDLLDALTLEFGDPIEDDLIDRYRRKCADALAKETP